MGKFSFRSPHYAFALLYLISMISYIDRQLISLLAADIQRDLGLHDWQLGFVSGTAFAILYGVIGIPLSILADRTHRVRLLAGCLTLWSVMTATCGLAGNFLQMSLARLGVAVGEAGGYPASISMIGDLYPASRRATVMSIFFSAVAAGMLVSFVIGGVINEHFGWRTTFLIAAAPGILVAVLMLITVPEPVRGAMDGQIKPVAQPILATFPRLIRNPVYRLIMVSSALANLMLFSMVAWLPTFAIRRFEIGTAEAGLGIGLSLGIMSAAIQIGGGLLADRLTKRSSAAPLRIAAIAQLLLIPAVILALYAPSFWVFCLAYALAFGFGTCNGPLTLSVVQTIVPVNVRATATALILLIGTLCGFGFGPPLVGIISDMVNTGDSTQSLRIALLAPLAVSVISALLLWIISRKPQVVDAAAAAARGEVHAESGA